MVAESGMRGGLVRVVSRAGSIAGSRLPILSIGQAQTRDPYRSRGTCRHGAVHRICRELPADEEPMMIPRESSSGTRRECEATRDDVNSVPRFLSSDDESFSFEVYLRNGLNRLCPSPSLAQHTHTQSTWPKYLSPPTFPNSTSPDGRARPTRRWPVRCRRIFRESSTRCWTLRSTTSC